MKICHYNNNQAGVIVGDKVYPIGDALIKAGLARNGYTMLEIIDALANNPAAIECASDAAKGSASIPLSSVKLLAPITNPGSLWAAAANYRAHQAEMITRAGHQDQGRINGGVLSQADVLHYRSQRHDPTAQNFQARRFRVRTLCRNRQARAKSDRGPGFELRFRLYDLLGHQPTGSVGTRHAQHAEYPKGF
jgi:hypothetical protein